MEDFPDKIRRNLVVFSAAIIIGWFLDLKLIAIAKLFVSAEIESVSPSKLWIVTACILCYLILRFKFDDNTNSQINSFSNEVRYQKIRYLYTYLSRQLLNIGRASKTSIILPSLSEHVRETIEHYKKVDSQRISCQLSISNQDDIKVPADTQYGGTIWQGELKVEEKYFSAARQFDSRGGVAYDFSIPPTGRLWIWIHALARATLYSKSSLELIVPTVLASFALLITIWKIAAPFLTNN